MSSCKPRNAGTSDPRNFVPSAGITQRPRLGGRRSGGIGTLPVLLLLLLAATAGTWAQTRLPLEQIRCEGLEHLDPQGVAATTGLVPGDPIDESDIRRACERLIRTGYFARVGYRYRGENGKLVVEFQLEEFQPAFPVMFDNFVGMSPDDLERELRAELPLYNGTIPASKEAERTIVGILEEVLRRRGLPAGIELTFYSDVAANVDYALLRLRGNVFPVAEIQFPGAPPEAEAALQRAVSHLLKRPYSAAKLLVLADEKLDSFLHGKGYLAARLAPPRAEPLENPLTVETPVRVFFPVEAGARFRWRGASWSGVRAFPPEKLTQLVELKPGALADVGALQEGIKKLKKAYWSRGFAEVRVDYEIVPDEGSAEATVRFAVREGPQYRMGQLHMEGIDPELASLIRSRWRLAPGDVFDADYPEQFQQEEVPQIVQEYFRRTGRVVYPDHAWTPDPDRKTVDVVFRAKQIQ